MSEHKMMVDWLSRLHSSYEETNKELEELERKILYDKDLDELKLNKIKKWINDNEIEQDVKENLQVIGESFSKASETNEWKLKFLKKDKKTLRFMIEKLENELRDW